MNFATRPSKENDDEANVEDEDIKVSKFNQPKYKFLSDFSSKIITSQKLGTFELISDNIVRGKTSRNPTQKSLFKLGKSNKDSKYHISVQRKKTKLSMIAKNDLDAESGSKKMFRELKPNISRLISLLSLSLKFMRSLRNATVYKKPLWLKGFHFKLINDMSFFGESLNFEQIRKRKFQVYFHDLANFFLRILNSEQKVIQPSNFLYILFNFIIMILIIACLIVIPIDAAFEVDFLRMNVDESFHSTIKALVLFFFVLDIALNFNTAYYEKGELIKKRTMIIQKYLKNEIFLDILGLLYFLWGINRQYPYENGYERLSGAFFLLKVRNISKILVRIEEFLFLDERYYNYLLFVKLSFRVILISHFFACIWNFIGTNTAGSWIENLQLREAPWEKRYVFSFYYVSVVMNTVGFGDITPKNLPEMVFTIIFIYFACGLFGYSLNSIGIILHKINMNERELKRDMITLNGYMRRKNINLKLRTKIRNFLEYVWHEGHIDNENATLEIMNKLSKSLKEELLLNANGVILRNIKLFNQNFSDEILSKLVCMMKEVKFIPRDTVYFQGETSEPAIYIVKKGEIELRIQTPQGGSILVETVKKNQFFGELSFFSDQPRETMARSATFTSVYVIKRQSFIDLLKENEPDYETFSMIKDRINLYEDFSDLYLACKSCKDVTHTTLLCPFLHFTRSKVRVLERYNYSTIQKRQTYKRKAKKTRFRKNGEPSKRSLVDSYFAFDSSFSSAENKNDISSITIVSLREDNKDSSMKFKEATSFAKSRGRKPVQTEETEIKNERIRSRSLPSFPEKIEEVIPPYEWHPKVPTLNDKKLTKNKTLVSFKESDENEKTYRRQRTTSRFKKDSTSQNFSRFSEQSFSYDEISKVYSEYFPQSNIDRIIAKVNEIIYLNLKRSKMLNIKKIRKTWMNKSNAKSREIKSPSVHKFAWKNIFEKPDFFKKIETQFSKNFTGNKWMQFLKENKIGIIKTKSRFLAYFRKKLTKIKALKKKLFSKA